MKKVALIICAIVLSVYAYAQPGGGGDPGHGQPCGGDLWSCSGDQSSWATNEVKNFQIAADYANPASNAGTITITNNSPTYNQTVKVNGGQQTVISCCGGSATFTVGSCTCSSGSGPQTIGFNVKITQPGAIGITMSLVGVSSPNSVNSSAATIVCGHVF